MEHDCPLTDIKLHKMCCELQNYTVAFIYLFIFNLRLVVSKFLWSAQASPLQSSVRHYHVNASTKLKLDLKSFSEN